MVSLDKGTKSYQIFYYICNLKRSMDVSVADGLKDKIEELVSRYEALKQENGELSAKVSSYEDIIRNNDLKIKELTQRLDNLQLISAFDGNTTEKAETKRKISKMIAEIDRCIAMLSE